MKGTVDKLLNFMKLTEDEEYEEEYEEYEDDEEDDEYGDYCSLSLDEDEMEKFLTGNTEQCHYFRLYDEYKIVQKQN